MREDSSTSNNPSTTGRRTISARTLADLGGVSLNEVEQRKSQIIQRVDHLSSYVWSVRQRKRAAELGEPVPLPEVAQPIGEQREAHSILMDVSKNVRLQVQSFQAEARDNPGWRSGSRWKSISASSAAIRSKRSRFRWTVRICPARCARISRSISPSVVWAST